MAALTVIEAAGVGTDAAAQLKVSVAIRAICWNSSMICPSSGLIGTANSYYWMSL